MKTVNKQNKTNNMKLFLFGNRPNVIERWNEILVSEHPRVLTASELNNEKISEGDVLIVHLSSVSVELSEQILRLKDKAPSIQIVCASDAPEEMEENTICLIFQHWRATISQLHSKKQGSQDNS